MKRVDLLSDIISSPEDNGNIVVPMSAAARRAEQAAARDTCPRGVTCIEDFSTDGRGMEPLYAALAKRDKLGRPVRIAYFGDSFIEIDILTADLRAALQSHFGGCGVGMVDVASPFTKLRSSVGHTASGWTEHNVLEKTGCDKNRLGITCRYALGGNGSRVTYNGTRAFAHVDTFEVATLYAGASQPLSLTATINKRVATAPTLGGNTSVLTASVTGRMGDVAFTLHRPATVYGVALEGRRGIVVDNFSLRGSSGLPLGSIPDAHLSGLYGVRPYDLVVLQFGLNVAAKGQLKYDNYVKQMSAIISRFRRLFPRAGILIVGIGDRENRDNGQLRTMPAVKALMSYQQTMAAEQGVAFWNLYEAMGGEGAIKRMADANPPEASKDYTHINFLGGKRVADKLYRALLHGYDQYLKRQ